MNRIENVLHTETYRETALYALAVVAAIVLATLAAPSLAQDKLRSSAPVLSQAVQTPFVDAARRAVRADGVRFHYATAGSGEPVVQLPGSPESWIARRIAAAIPAFRRDTA